MTIRHLKIFIEVAQWGNMTAAASKLFISQPTVSQAIKELEEHYGILLFERLSKRLYITEAGKKLLFYAKEVVKEFNSLEENMKAISKIEKIRIGATISVGDSILSDLIYQCMKENPKMEIYSSVGNTETIEKKLLNNELDIAIVEGKIKSQDLIVKPVLNDYLVLICSTKHPFAKKKITKIDELRDESFAMREKGSGTRELFEEYMLNNGIPIKIVFEGNTPQSIKQEVIHNNCLSVMSIGLVENEIKDSVIHVIKNEENTWNRYFSIVYHKDKLLTDAIKTLMNIIKDYQYLPFKTIVNAGILRK
ncbi:MAG TPA: LysR family transcriptional regulator [Tissierellia bacterium]|nr:LysR family transcriptional regulator [Tissierellia bacterium]